MDANIEINWYKYGIHNYNDSMWDTEELNFNPDNKEQLFIAKFFNKTNFLKLAKKYNWLPKKYSSIKSYQNMLNRWIKKNNYIK